MENIKYNKEDIVDHHAVFAIIKDKDNKILMQEHNKYGFWTIPGGKAKPDQKPIEALKQEIFEECNITIIDSKEITTRIKNYIRQGINVKVTEHIFEIIKYSGIMKNNEPDKHKSQKFLSLEEIKNLPAEVLALY